MNRARIVVVGSSNTDMVVKSQRIPVPGETVTGGQFVMAPGGKGANQAVAAARLGAEVSFVARVGQDMFGEQAVEGYHKEGILTDLILQDPKNHTGVALIMVDEQGENLISVASGANHALTPQDVERAYTILLQLAASESRRGNDKNGRRARDAVDSIRKHVSKVQEDHDNSRRLREAENRQTADQITRARKAEAEVIRQEQELAGLKKALADAAMEINCAGPVAHRIRVLKEEHAKHIKELKSKLAETYGDCTQCEEDCDTCASKRLRGASDPPQLT